MKKVLIIVFLVFLLLIISCSIGGVVYYNNSLGPMEKDSSKVTNVTITIQSGTSSQSIIDILYDAGLIKNKYTGYVFVKLNIVKNLQAGTYELNTGMSLEEILEVIKKGQVRDDSISVTFIEGKRIANYVNVISENFGYSKEEILDKINSKEYLEKLVEKYWFLTEDIFDDKLKIALEGYLAPNTYYFDKDASLEAIIEKLLDATGKVLDKYKDDIEKSDFSVHEILTLASVIQNEGKVKDFKMISSVFHNRLDIGMKLESCATSYYGADVEFNEIGIANEELISKINSYNTYVITGLPVGPISSPSMQAIDAVLNPEESNYLFFLSDNEGVTYFFATYSEQQNKKTELMQSGKWDR